MIKSRSGSATALDILCVLALADGALVSKDELIARVWPGVVVEENNLHVHISALRKALAEEDAGQTCLVNHSGARLPARRSAEHGAARNAAWRG